MNTEGFSFGDRVSMTIDAVSYVVGDVADCCKELFRPAERIYSFAGERYEGNSLFVEEMRAQGK